MPNTVCIMKAEFVNSVFFGAGYIRNTPLRAMVQAAVDDLSQGNHLLLFPEGTRTVSIVWAECTVKFVALGAKH